MNTTSHKALAVVLGDIDMLRPLVLAGITCGVCADKGALPRYSRYARELISWVDPWTHSKELVDILLDFASMQNSKPVLFYESDADLLMISRWRGQLTRGFRFVIPEEKLTEALVDKFEFQRLAERLSLPVPRTRVLSEEHDLSPDYFDLRFPVVVKPLTRRMFEWKPIAGLSKAVRINSLDELAAFKNVVGSTGAEFLLQEMIAGDESAIESYHVYVDENSEIAGEFTGRKIRTYPVNFGQSCALEISGATDVTEIGRDIIKKIGLRGLAKLDFKRDPTGSLYLLEINPRFSLWHHLGAVAGVNLPLMVYCDLVGLPRPDQREARVGTTWCRPWRDVVAARQQGISFLKWLAWLRACEAVTGIYSDDPFPVLGAALSRVYQKLTPSPLQRKVAGGELA